MGARSFGFSACGYSAREVFSQKVDEDAYEYGHNYYNGHGYSARLNRCLKKFDKYTTTAQKAADKIIEKYWDDDEGRKNEIDYIDLGVVEYHVIKRKAKTTPTKNAPKFELKYCLYSNKEIGAKDDRFILSDKDKNVVIKKMFELADKYPNAYIEKEYVCVSGKTRVAEIETDISVKRSKPKTIPAGAVLKEVHKYVFFGWVAE